MTEQVMIDGNSFYGNQVEKAYLWSRLSLIKRFFLVPVFFIIWVWIFFRFYWLNNIQVILYDELKSSYKEKK